MDRCGYGGVWGLSMFPFSKNLEKFHGCND